MKDTVYKTPPMRRSNHGNRLNERQQVVYLGRNSTVGCTLRFAALMILFLLSGQSFAGTLHGRVIAKDSHVPIAGARVSLPGTRFGTVSV